MAKLFLIVYNEVTVPKSSLVAVFDKYPGVITWFSQLSGSFFIKTNDTLTAKSISLIIDEKFNKASHVVVKVHKAVMEDYYGRISKDLWNNFY